MEKKFSMIEETTSKTKTGEYNKVQKDQNHGEAVAPGFHGDLTEQEVEQLLRETIAEIGMSTEMSKSSVHPNLSHMLSQIFNDNDERNKVRQISKHFKKTVEK